MLVATNLGASTDRLGPEATAAAPGYTTTLQHLKSAEDDLWMSYTNITMITIAGGPDLPRQLLLDYNEAQAALVEGADDWLKLRAQIPKADLPDPDAEVVAPPTFTVPSAPISGLFGVATVPVSQVGVNFGPRGREKTLPLGSAEAQQLGHYGAQAGLGLGPLAVGAVLILLGVTVVFMAFALVIKEWSRAKVEANKAKAIESRELGKRILAATTAAEKMMITCVGTSTDDAHRLKCQKQVNETINGILKNTPKVSGGGNGSGLGFFGWVGAIVVISGAAVGGYYLFQRRSARRAVRQGGRFAPQADWPDDDYNYDIDRDQDWAPRTRRRRRSGALL